MPQTNYQKGYRLERKAVKELRDKGYYVVRSAGSHGAVDLVAFNAQEIILIQVGVKGRKTKIDEEMLRRVPAPKRTIRQMWLWWSEIHDWVIHTL